MALYLAWKEQKWRNKNGAKWSLLLFTGQARLVLVLIMFPSNYIYGSVVEHYFARNELGCREEMVQWEEEEEGR